MNIAFILRRSFTSSKVVFRRDSYRFTQPERVLSLMASGMLSFLFVIVGSASFSLPVIAACLLAGPAVVAAFTVFINRHSIPVVTQAGVEASVAYHNVKHLLNRRVRKAALKAILAHDAALSGLFDAEHDVREARAQVRVAEWSSPLVAEELATRESELKAEVQSRLDGLQALRAQFKSVVNADTTARREAATAADAINAVSALTESRKALTASRGTSVPTLELV